MKFVVPALLAFLLIQCLVGLIWWVAYRIQRTSIVDIYWSLFIFIAAGFYFLYFASGSIASLFFLMLAFFWAARLSAHIYFRSRGHGEDSRYQALRQQWGEAEKKKMLVFYFQQGVAAWIFSLPFLLIFSNPRGVFGAWEIAGVFIWIIAFNGESISDAQLMLFKQEPQNKGKVCRGGFWKYSRHPNYFFEWLNWIAFAWLAFPHSMGWLALICPGLMYYFLNKVSGVPLAEKQALKNRSEEYVEYQRVTPVFFPWLPKKSELLK